MTRDQSASPQPAPHEAVEKAKGAAPAEVVTATATPESTKVGVKPTVVADRDNDYLAEVKKLFEIEAFFDFEKLSKKWKCFFPKRIALYCYLSMCRRMVEQKLAVVS